MSRPPASLAIRADGDARLGLGHMMRCAALAQALLDDGHRVVWFSTTPQTIPFELARRIEVRSLPQDGRGADTLLPALAHAGLHHLVGDWQRTDPALCRQLRRAGVWLALIGNHLGGAEAELIIHQGFGPAPADKAGRVCGGSEHILLAPGYAGLPPRIVEPQVKRLLISLGGSETPVLETILAALDKLPTLHGVEIDIRRAAQRGTAPRETGLLDELRAADIAILGAGTTLHEAAATGLAAIAVPITENQLERAQQFKALGLGLSLAASADGFEQGLQQAVGALLGNLAQRQAFARAGQAAIDGCGARRVASEITRCVSHAHPQRGTGISTANTGPSL